jgi:hypothetical protein
VFRYDKSFTSPIVLGVSLAMTALLGFLAFVAANGFVYWILLVTVWFLLLNFFCCRVTVDEELVIVRYGIGLFQRSFTRHSVQSFYTSQNEKIIAWIYRPFAETSLVVIIRGDIEVSLPASSPKELADIIDNSGRRP